MSDADEAIAGTDPTNPLSVLRVASLQMASSSNAALAWLSVTGKTYTIQGTTNLLLGFPEVAGSNIAATSFGTNSSSLPVGQEPRKFYRVRVE